MLVYQKTRIEDLTRAQYEACFSAMQEGRREKVVRLRRAEDRMCTLAGEFLVRNLLFRHTGMPFEQAIIRANEKGKLCLENGDTFFNISHSNGLVYAAICDKPIGIDVEKVRPISMKAAKRICTENELFYLFNGAPKANAFEQEPSAETLNRFYKIWTLKEAYFKCIGSGITDFLAVDTVSGVFQKKLLEDGAYIAHIVTL